MCYCGSDLILNKVHYELFIDSPNCFDAGLRTWMDLFHLFFQYRLWIRRIGFSGYDSHYFQRCDNIADSSFMCGNVHFRLQTRTITSYS